MGKMIFLYCLSLTFALAAYFTNSLALLLLLYVAGWIWSYHLFVKYSKIVAAVSRAKKRKS